jgi:hypothetical protein
MKTLLKAAIYSAIVVASARPALAADAVTGGVTVGTNIGSFGLSGSDSAGVTTSSKAGLAIGGFVEAPINKYFSIQPEVYYSMKPFDVNDSGKTQNEHIDLIEVPVLARINFPSSSSAHVYLLAGPGFSFLVRAKETEPNGSEQDLKPGLENADVSIMGGLGVEIGRFGIEGRYDGGLRNLNKGLNQNGPNDVNFKDRLSVKSRAFTIMVRYAFR